jgi:hypothetical protein
LKECGKCREEFEELTLLTGDLPFASEPESPPSGMKERVLANVFAEEVDSEKEIKEHDFVKELKEDVIERKTKTKPNWFTPLLAASLMFSLIGNAYTMLNNETAEEEPGVIESTDKLFKAVDLTPSEAIASTGTASMIEKDDGMSLVVQANNLQQLEGTQTYQVWLLEDGEPYRAGTFVPNENGLGAVTYNVDEPGALVGYGCDHTRTNRRQPNPTR